MFVRGSGTWSQQAYLKASNTGRDDSFGVSVAASGETVVIGAAGEDSDATGVDGDESNDRASAAGAAYVFTRCVRSWRQQSYLKASNAAAGDWFGRWVSVSNDTAAIAALYQDRLGRDAGASYVFAGIESGPRAEATWVHPVGAYATPSGAGVALGDVDLDGTTDVVTLAADRTGPGSIRFDWAVGAQLDPDGRPGAPIRTHSWSTTSLATPVFGAGVALADVNRTGGPDLLVMLPYTGGGTPRTDVSFQWSVGYDLSPTGSVAGGWSARHGYDTFRPSTRSGGAGIAVGSFDTDPRPDAICAWSEDGPSCGNTYRYALLRNLRADGSASQTYPAGVVPHVDPFVYTVPGHGCGAQGADVAIADLDADPRPEIVLMSYGAPAGPNDFRWKIGWNADDRGSCAQWTDRAAVLGAGISGDGAGVALGQWNRDPRPDLVFTALDPGAGGVHEWRSRMLTDALGVFTPFGTGCPSGLGTAPALALPPRNLPERGAATRVHARGVAPTGTSGYLLLDPGPAGPPVQLGFLGFPSCSLLVSSWLHVPFATAHGTTDLVAVIPPVCGTIESVRVQGAFVRLPTLGLSEGREIRFDSGR